jgi:hypothetical protein
VATGNRYPDFPTNFALTPSYLSAPVIASVVPGSSIVPDNSVNVPADNPTFPISVDGAKDIDTTASASLRLFALASDPPVADERNVTDEALMRLAGL